MTSRVRLAATGKQREFCSGEERLAMMRESLFDARDIDLPSLIPREVLFGNADRHLPSISPDARRLAYLAPENGVMNLFAGEIGGDPRCLTSERERPIRQYRWAPNSRHLLYLQDSGGAANYHVFPAALVSGGIVDPPPSPPPIPPLL